MPLDVTILNLASRPVTLSHVGIEVVEITASFDRMIDADLVRSLPRRAPVARKVEKQEEYSVQGRDLFKLLRPHVVRARRQGGGHGPAILSIGEVAWTQLDDPVHLESGAPYRFGMIVRDAREHLPGQLVVRLAARTQLGEHRSNLIELTMPG